MSQFVPRLVNYRYRVNVPAHVDPPWSHWEPERLTHMEERLTHHDILFDVGAEQGWQSVIYAGFVGPGNMVLVEPCWQLWPNIRETWAANAFHDLPRAVYCGFFADRTVEHPWYFDHDPTVGVDGWPACAHGPQWEELSFNLLHESAGRVDQVTLDDFVARTGVVPTAISMDVEGSELQVLRGAQNTLRGHDVQVWVSIHPDHMVERYGTHPAEILQLTGDLGYRSEFIVEDHEQHWYFRKS